MTPLVLSVSEVRALQQCERRYQHEYVLDRRSAPNHEMLWGSALHRGLEGWFGIWKLDWTEIRSRLFEPTSDYTPPPEPYARAAASAVLRAYVESWHEDRANWTVLGVEVPFMLPILTGEGRRMRSWKCERCGGDGMPKDEPCAPCDCLTETEYRMLLDQKTGTGRLRPMREGYLDMIVRDQDQLTWVVERKTTGWDPSSERFYTGLELDLQTKTYFDAARELGYAPAGVIYDVIRRPDYHEPKPPPALKKDGTPRVERTRECDVCEGCRYEGPSETDVTVGEKCKRCAGTGRVSIEPSYTNPRHGETPAAYEERIYNMASARPEQWFARRPLPISEAQVRDAREAFQGAADRVLRARRTGLYPKVLNRYVCAPPKKHGEQRICPWFDVCNGTRSIETFPTKRER